MSKMEVVDGGRERVGKNVNKQKRKTRDLLAEAGLV
jgi:hypothetical protein